MGVSWTKETISNSGTAGTTTAESLTIDNIKIDGTTIGHTSDTDLMSLSSGALLLNGTITVGVNGTGHDVKFFGDTSGKYMEWDQSADQLDVTGSLDVTGNTTMIGTLTVGVDNTGHDVKFYGATASNYMLWDESEDRLKLFIDDGGEALRIYSSDAGDGTGPGIGLYRQSSSTADSDKNGYISFNAYDATNSNNTVYGKIYSQMKVVADGNEQGVLHLAVMTESSGSNAVQTGLKLSGSNTNDEINVLVPKGELEIGDNNSVQGIIEVHRGSTSLPGVVNLRQCDNGHGYIWVDNDGKLRVHTSAPAAHDNGTIVGTQTA
tara:strand:- start:493 stop:1455 length:963 start_codon:yes stop_codon:yes gene_type:complete